jgi:hypothetical protein
LEVFAFRGDPPVLRSMGEAAAGDDGPGVELEVFSAGLAGGWGDCDFDFDSLFVRGKFWQVSDSHWVVGHGA